ncbi:TniQ family protein [Alkalibacillus sp. S2W]|uniref:TniQ family protein n=1 Tax=Alkalibacillus sp. S2W TaxID=3386553 RepID=UPI00398D3BB1
MEMIKKGYQIGCGVLISSRSKLYNLKPINSDGAYVESLSSYISRLAQKHNILVGDIVNDVVTPLLNKKYLEDIISNGGDGFFKSSNAINGTGVMAEDFVKVIELLTQRRDLFKSTLLKLEGEISIKGLLRKNKAWCPLCIEKQFKNGIDIYEPLIWSISEYKVCTTHHTPLVDHCSNCNKKMYHLNRKSINGFCSRCSTNLGEESISENASESDLNHSEQIETLVNWLVKFKDVDLEDMFINKSIQQMTDSLFDQKVGRAAKHFTIPESTYRDWYKERRVPNLSSLLKICDSLNIDIESLLNKEVEMKRTLIMNEKKSQESHSLKINSTSVEVLLENVVANQIPLSLTEVAGIIGRDRTSLTKSFPELTEKIKAQKKENISDQKLKRQRDLEQQLVRVIGFLVKCDIYPSIPAVEEIIGENTLRERKVKDFYTKLVSEDITYY